MKHQIRFGAKEINFTLSFSERRSLTIKVHPAMIVEVLAPIGTDQAKVYTKVKSKAPWILNQIEHFRSFKPGTPSRRFINGETHLYLGRQYRLKIVPDTTDQIKVYRGQMFINASDTAKPALEQQLDKWYKEQAKIVFGELVEEVLPRFKKYKVQQPVISIRKMSHRWGSCTASGKIILNIDLIKASKGCIEYVIVHELGHLVHHNHTKLFLHLLNKMSPDWKKWKDRLEYLMC